MHTIYFYKSGPQVCLSQGRRSTTLTSSLRMEIKYSGGFTMPLIVSSVYWNLQLLIVGLVIYRHLPNKHLSWECS